RANVNPTKTLVPIEAATFGLSNSYQVLPYPVDNFGILTAYKPPLGERWDESNEICATWSCLGVDANKVPTDPNERLSVSGFADTGTGGTIRGRPLKNAELNISSPFGNFHGLTDSLGGYKLPGVAPGRYQIDVSF